MPQCTQSRNAAACHSANILGRAKYPRGQSRQYMIPIHALSSHDHRQQYSAHTCSISLISGPKCDHPHAGIHLFYTTPQLGSIIQPRAQALDCQGQQSVSHTLRTAIDGSCTTMDIKGKPATHSQDGLKATHNCPDTAASAAACD